MQNVIENLKLFKIINFKGQNNTTMFSNNKNLTTTLYQHKNI